MALPPKKFIKKNGVNMLNPDYLAWKKQGGTTGGAAATPWQSPIDRMTVAIYVEQGSDLVPMDRNMFGKRISSDPYVRVILLCTPPHTISGQTQKKEKIELGRTSTVKKNLSPTWGYSVKSDIPYSRKNETPRLVFEIFDEDKLSKDDSMGVITLPALEWKDSSTSTAWYEIPKGSAKNVSGKVQIKIKTKVHRVEGLKSYF